MKNILVWPLIIFYVDLDTGRRHHLRDGSEDIQPRRSGTCGWIFRFDRGGNRI